MDALVLAGGGSRGSYQAGAYMGMRQEGFVPNLLVGTSVGAINGAHIAAGIDDEGIRAIWSNLTKRGVGRVRKDVWRFWTWQSLMRPDPLRRLLEKLDFRAIHRAPFDFLVTATDVETGRVKVWHKEELTVDHLLASAAIPGIFPPVEIEGHLYMDGAVSNNAPIRPAISEGADRILLILTDELDATPERRPRNVPELLARVGNIHSHQSLRKEYMKGKQINAILASGREWGEWRHVDFQMLTPSRPLQGTMDYHPARNVARMELGVRDGAAFARRILGKP